MFNRRDSHRLSSELVATFKRSFPNLIHRADGAQSLATPPVATSIEIDSDDFMSFDPHLFGHVEEDSEQATTPGGSLINPATSQAGSSSGNYGFLDFHPQWHPSPGPVGYYAQPMQYQWPQSTQQRFPTPASRSHSLPSSTHLQQPAFLSLQDVQLQPSYHAGNFDFPAYHQAFSPQATGLAGYTSQHQGSIQGLPSSSQHQPPLGAHGRTSLPSSEFRFQISLMNGTAMVKENDIPVSYLNKRQTYKIVIRDTRPERSGSVPTTYRTFIRVSFQEEKQRSRPDQHWQLWKEGRGMNEAQQHGGKLQAIEYVAQSQAPGHHTSVHLEKESFDGFCVTWSTPNGLAPQCEVQFRCNFLSTDFSRSKGVKGIPVRLCAKSEVVAFSNSMGPPPSLPEICYCKIKLFRDHGAERKLTNDEAAVKRLITKTEEQIKQSQPEPGEETSVTTSGKRRGSDLSPSISRPSKIPRGKRASSVSSDGSSQVQESGDGDLSHKLGNLTRLLRSRQDVTMFFLRGGEPDDPDLHPVFLRENTDEPTPKPSPELKREERRDAETSDLSAAISPKTVHLAVSPQHHHSNLQLPTPVTSQHPSSDGTPCAKADSIANDAPTTQQALESSVTRFDNAKHVTTGGGSSIEALDVDPIYRPPSGPAPKPVACLYVRIKTADTVPQDEYYRAIYLYQRTFRAFLDAITKKANVNPFEVVDTIYRPASDQRGMSVQMDDDVVLHIPEGQDIEAEFVLSDTSTPTNERAMSLRTHSQSRGPPRYNLIVRY